MPWYQIVALGCLGGAVPDVLRLISLRYEEAPSYLFRWFFWISLGYWSHWAVWSLTDYNPPELSTL